jgi:hypothetical protein
MGVDGLRLRKYCQGELIILLKIIGILVDKYFIKGMKKQL